MATQNTAMDNAALIKEVNEAHKHKKYSVGYHAQTVVAVIVTLIMLFPLYWMIATSFKSAEEVQLVIPTLFPHEFHPENYLNVLQKANFMKYYWNTIVMTAGILLPQGNPSAPNLQQHRAAFRIPQALDVCSGDKTEVLQPPLHCRCGVQGV